ncbi:MAG: tRNA (adenine(22)-N(1))-methyltransferase TrmK, partial [Oscillospiraceae bacterium]
KNGVNLVLQPMTRAYFLRKWLYENGFEIVEEDVAECENRLYSVVKARYIGEFSGVDDVFERLGKIDISKSLGQKYAKNQAKILEKVGNGLKNSRENLEKSMSKLSTAEKIRQKLEEYYD